MTAARQPAFAEPLQQVDRTYVLWRGRRLSYFGGCDYFRLSSDARILRAVRGALGKVGLNVAASRMTTGNHALYGKVEKAAARFFGSGRAILVSNGYLTNLVVAQALAGTVSHLLADQAAHPSLLDAAAILRCPIAVFRHRDPADAARKFAALESRQGVALLTDGLFAADGSLAPLREYRQALGPDLLLWVDDAHAAGVLGARGRGSVEEAGLGRGRLVQTVTFSKAFGVYGGAVLCDASLAGRIVASSHALIGNTPLPLPLAAGVLESLRLVRGTPALRRQLRQNIAAFWRELGASGPGSPIVSLTPADPTRLRRDLLAAGIYPSFIRYPGGPSAGYFRFALSSGHTAAQIKTLATVLAGVEIQPPE